MVQQRTIEQRLEFLEASVRSFSATYAELEKVLEKTEIDVQGLGSGLQETARLVDGMGWGRRTEPLKGSANAAFRIAQNIRAALDKLRTYWYGPEWKEMTKEKMADESIKGKD